MKEKKKMSKIEHALKLAKDCTYADEMTEGAKEFLRMKIDEALEELNQDKEEKISKGISRREREFEKLVKVYSTKICSEIIKNGFEGVELWVRVAMSETLNTKNS
jgi:gamma-glutamylcysteine synthetase